MLWEKKWNKRNKRATKSRKHFEKFQIILIRVFGMENEIKKTTQEKRTAQIEQERSSFCAWVFLCIFIAYHRKKPIFRLLWHKCWTGLRLIFFFIRFFYIHTYSTDFVRKMATFLPNIMTKLLIPGQKQCHCKSQITWYLCNVYYRWPWCDTHWNKNVHFLVGCDTDRLLW